MTRLLVVSSDSRWRSYLEYGLPKNSGIEVEGIDGYAAAMKEVQDKPKDHFGAILVDGGAPTGRTQDEVEHEISTFVSGLRANEKGQGGDPVKPANALPILLWSACHAEGLSRIASRFDRTRLLDNDTYDTIKATLAVVTSGKKAAYASVEIELSSTHLSVRVSIDGRGVIARISRTPPWRETLQDLEDKFKIWALWQRCAGQPPRYTDYWSSTFKEAGQRLTNELDEGQLDALIDECLVQVEELRNVHFRFSVVGSDIDATCPYANVPFELLYHRKKDEFIRSLAPIARRLGLSRGQRIATPRPTARTFLGRLLFIESNAFGAAEIPGTQFAGNPQLLLPRLSALGNEFTRTKAARGNAASDKLELSAGVDCMKILQAALSDPTQPAPEIVHFSGHSAQADDGSVYLMVPGLVAGQVRPLAVSEFAAWLRTAGVQLVLLSSCESSRPDAAFRLAQYGIPAAIGFRWEVADTEAADFMVELHRELASKMPLARAFHASIAAVKRDFKGSPTFASPMLVIQDDEWTS